MSEKKQSIEKDTQDVGQPTQQGNQSSNQSEGTNTY